MTSFESTVLQLRAEGKTLAEIADYFDTNVSRVAYVVHKEEQRDTARARHEVLKTKE